MIFFISDLHLSPRSPGATALFLRFLAGRARQAEALYFLGDLFEVWVGDDIDDETEVRRIAHDEIGGLGQPAPEVSKGPPQF